MPDRDPAESLSSLVASLPDLEKALESMFDQKWPEMRDSLEPMERAKLDILMAYTINDLVWIYLKLKGVDPANHEVSSELERIKTYYAKVRAVEEPEQKRTRKVDVPAAARFISSAIPSSQRSQPTTGDPGPSSSAQALAAEQAKRALEEKESIERLGMGNRFRFVAEKGERLSPKSDEDEDEAAEESGNDEAVIEVDEDQSKKGNKKKNVPSSRKAQQSAVDEKSKNRRSKRKRAEDFT